MNVAIGQGELLVTPLQMAMVAAAVANGGRVMGPRLVRRILDAQGGTVRDMPLRDMGSLPLDPAHLALVRRGLVEVVDAGTARRAAIPDVRVWGQGPDRPRIPRGAPMPGSWAAWRAAIPTWPSPSFSRTPAPAEGRPCPWPGRSWGMSGAI